MLCIIGVNALAHATLNEPAWTSALLCMALLAWVYIRWALGLHDLLCLGNLFVAGFALFQLQSVWDAVRNDEIRRFTLFDPSAAAVEFVLLSMIFMTGFFAAYHLTVRGAPLADARRSAESNPPRYRGPVPLATLAVLATVAAYVGRFGMAGLVGEGLVASIGRVMGVASASVAAGMITWWAMERVTLTRSVLALLVITAQVPAMIFGAFGRRPLVALFGAVLWAAWYARLRFIRPRRAVTVIAGLAVVPVLLVALFSDSRTHRSDIFTLGERLELIVEDGEATAGLADLISGQGTGSATLWVIENYPEVHESRPFFSVLYFVSLPVPRQLWPDKPSPISAQVARNAELRAVRTDQVKIPAGVIGNAAAEGGPIAAATYGLLIGLLVGAFDRRAMRDLHDPLTVIVIGCNLGQILGLARGETSVFAAIFVVSVVALRLGLWAATVAASSLIEYASPRFASTPRLDQRATVSAVAEYRSS